MSNLALIRFSTIRRLLRCSCLFALALAVHTVQANAELQTREQFTEVFVRAAHARWPDGVVSVVGPGHVSVRLKGKEKYEAFLDNAYTQYRAEPASMSPIIAAHLASIEGAKSAGDNKIDGRKVFAVIKPYDYVPTVLAQLGELKTGKKPLPPVNDALNEDMSVLYVEDSDSGMKYLTDEMLEDAGVPRAGLRALAESNMRRYFKSVTPTVLQPDGAEQAYTISPRPYVLRAGKWQRYSP